MLKWGYHSLVKDSDRTTVELPFCGKPIKYASAIFVENPLGTFRHTVEYFNFHVCQPRTLILELNLIFFESLKVAY
jgi:hypothetical protein